MPRVVVINPKGHFMGNKEEKRTFKTKQLIENLPDDPEALFLMLPKKAEGIKHLWAQQADILRA